MGHRRRTPRARNVLPNSLGDRDRCDVRTHAGRGRGQREQDATRPLQLASKCLSARAPLTAVRPPAQVDAFPTKSEVFSDSRGTTEERLESHPNIAGSAAKNPLAARRKATNLKGEEKPGAHQREYRQQTEKHHEQIRTGRHRQREPECVPADGDVPELRRPRVTRVTLAGARGVSCPPPAELHTFILDQHASPPHFFSCTTARGSGSSTIFFGTLSHARDMNSARYGL